MTRDEEGEGLPCFRTEDGFSYSHGEMNRDLRRIFKDRIRYGKVSGHSFRIGLASLLAECGYSDEGKLVKQIRREFFFRTDHHLSVCRDKDDGKVELSLFRDVHPPAKSDTCTNGKKASGNGGAGRPLLGAAARRRARLKDAGRRYPLAPLDCQTSNTWSNTRFLCCRQGGGQPDKRQGHGRHGSQRRHGHGRPDRAGGGGELPRPGREPEEGRGPPPGPDRGQHPGTEVVNTAKTTGKNEQRSVQ